MPAAWRPLPAPVPSPRKKPFAELHRLGIVLAREAQIVERFIDAVAGRQQFRMSFARVDDGFELRVGKNAVARPAGCGSRGR